MQIERLIVGAFKVNCYILTHENGKALLIDPGDDAEVILDLLNRRRLTVSAYLLTHGHMDHISALATLYSAMPAPIRMHSKDATWTFSATNQLLPHYAVPVKPDREIDHIQDNNTLPEETGFKIIHTPGHTPGSICLYHAGEGVLFSGDTLFRESVGRTDYPGGNSRQLSKSLKRLQSLPSNTQVHPGHGPATSIAHECEYNYFMS